MINLDQLRIFRAVAQSRSFTRAAELVHLTQPGISKHIKQMETYFGVRLFDRSGKKVALTESGEVLFEATQEVMAIIDAAERRIDDVKGLRGGRLRLGSSFPVGVYLLPKVLAEFRRRYPAVDVTLDISLSERIEAKVMAGELDLGLVSYDARNPRLLTRAFMTDELIAIVPPNHPWATKRQIKPQELTRRDLHCGGTRSRHESGRRGAAQGAGHRASERSRFRKPRGREARGRGRLRSFNPGQERGAARTGRRHATWH